MLVFEQETFRGREMESIRAKPLDDALGIVWTIAYRAFPLI